MAIASGKGEVGCMYNCHVDGGDNPKIRDSDPFEAMLALCRVIGVDYDIREHDGRWSCKLTPILAWPADFYGGAGSQGGKRSFGICNCLTRLDAITGALPMLFSSIHRSCTAWREIAKSHPDYVEWFKRDNEMMKPAPETETGGSHA